MSVEIYGDVPNHPKNGVPSFSDHPRVEATQNWFVKGLDVIGTYPRRSFMAILTVIGLAAAGEHVLFGNTATASAERPQLHTAQPAAKAALE